MPDNLEEMFAAVAERTRRLMEQLTVAPLMQICGLIDSTGAGLTRSGQEILWTLVVSLPIWRDATGEIQTRTLYLRRERSFEEAKECQARIRPGAIMRFKARVVEHSVFERPEGLLVEVLGLIETDLVLNQQAMERQRPVYHDDAVLGRFTLNRKYGWYEAKADWLGKPIDVRLSVDDMARVDSVATNVRRLWVDRPGWDERIRRCATDELLSLKNGNWLEDNEATVTAPDFSKRLAPEAVHLHLDGSFSFWFGDDDLFWGHSIEVNGTVDAGPQDARLQG